MITSNEETRIKLEHSCSFRRISCSQAKFDLIRPVLIT